LVGEAGQVWADVAAGAGQLVTGGAVLGEERLAAGRVAGELQDARVTIDDLLPVRVHRAAEQPLGPGAEVLVPVPQPLVPAGGVHFGGRQVAPLDRVQGGAEPVVAAGQ